MNEYNWYVIYTKPNAEKKVAQRLLDRQNDVFLPLATETRIWSDRKKTIQEPLFKSYVFVRCSIDELHKIKTVYGFSHFVSFGGYPAVIPEKQIGMIKSIIAFHSDAKSVATRFIVGERVDIIAGPLAGMQGTLTQINGKNRVAIEVNHLNQSMLITLPEAYLMKLEHTDELAI
ncbi:transcription termination/antitermination protein NusG [Marinomonas balearica]|uniref:Transcription elongation factor/antiterminator RfaH n=1 Tax=Marinomonas balearica TaxID=491947 RepID=A0A4R6M6F9_9GAMM|nr:UpxY family transcription antiterminator [Marinomonas balearica]TDO96676.1 transcription elongation factor/antiterminator RfaH [Marinomonas balearica]